MKYKVTLNNKVYEVEVEKGTAILQSEYDVVAPAVSSAAAPAVTNTAPAVNTQAPVNAGDGDKVTSPLPGVINEVKVKQGDSVKKGQVLIIIEAMKMENDISAPKDGTITSVLVSKGTSVERGTVLLTIK